MKIVNDADSLWKDIIEEFFEDFMLFFAKDLHNLIDFSKGCEFLEKEFKKLFKDSERKKRHVDKLAKVHLKDGEEKWILVHVEVQGYKEEEFPERMFQYFYRVYDKHRKKIFAIAIFSDDSKKYKPESFNYGFFGTELTYKYNTYKILEQEEEKLKRSANPFAMVVLAALYTIKTKKNNNARKRFKYNLTERLSNAKWGDDKIDRLFLFIDGIMQLPEDLALEFNTELEELIGKGESRMALTWENSQTYQIRFQKRLGEEVKKEVEKVAEKATEKTKRQELVKMVSILLCKKFKLDSLPNKISQKIDGTEISNLESIRDNIFDIESLEEAVKYL